MKGIENINSEGQYHGYQEWCTRGMLWVKCFFNNGIPVDYEEEYNSNGSLKKSFYI